MSNIELVLTDFDGTVVEFGKHVISDQVRQTLIECENNGVRVVPVTGRYYAMALPVLEILGFEDVGVFDNGATIQHCKTGEVIWSKWLDAKTVCRIASICAPLARIIDYSELHNEHVPADNELEIIDKIVEPASHVYALIAKKDIPTVEEGLTKISNITYYWAPSTRPNNDDAMGVQINHHEADKYHGVNALRNILGIGKEATLAIGDGDNDVALFENAAIKIAMGNATEKLKQRADYEVASVDQDGFVQAMREHVL